MEPDMKSLMIIPINVNSVIIAIIEPRGKQRQFDLNFPLIGELFHRTNNRLKSAKNIKPGDNVLETLAKLGMVECCEKKIGFEPYLK